MFERTNSNNFFSRYPDKWYEDIASNHKFFSLAAVDGNEIVGLIVTEVKLQSKCNREDQGLLGYQFSKKTTVAYILTLGVVTHYRRKGVATLLLDSLISYLTNDPSAKECKAVYLHVLTTNQVAINFYERRQFKKFMYLPLYYTINGSAKDGYAYVLYINGGQPPWNVLSPFIDAANDIYSLSLTVYYSISSTLSNTVCLLFQVLIPRKPCRWLKSWCASVSDSVSRLIFRSPSPQKYHHLANA